MRRRVIFLTGLSCFVDIAIFTVVCPLQAQPETPQAYQESCQTFVQEFYDWYVPKASDGGSDVALKYKSKAFSPELLRALQGDSKAQAKVKGDIVGLDFDPFLDTQDAEDHYVLGAVTRKGDSCRVEVYGVRSGIRYEGVSVVPELRIKDGRWRFVNFHYPNPKFPENENLLSVLSTLSQDRHDH